MSASFRIVLLCITFVAIGQALGFAMSHERFHRELSLLATDAFSNRYYNEAAIAFYRLYRAAEAPDSLLINNLATALAMRGDVPHALALYHKLVSTSPEYLGSNPNLRDGLGLVNVADLPPPDAFHSLFLNEMTNTDREFLYRSYMEMSSRFSIAADWRKGWMYALRAAVIADIPADALAALGTYHMCLPFCRASRWSFVCFRGALVQT